MTHVTNSWKHLRSRYFHQCDVACVSGYMASNKKVSRIKSPHFMNVLRRLGNLYLLKRTDSGSQFEYYHFQKNGKIFSGHSGEVFEKCIIQVGQ